MVINRAKPLSTGQVVKASSASIRSGLDRMAKGRSPSDLQWEDADPNHKQRSATVQIYGETDTGRTTLALSAPGPIAYLHSLEKVKAVAAPFAKAGKVIRFLDFGGAFIGTPEEIEVAAMERVRYFKRAWQDAFTWARTVVIDTDTDLWMLYRLAYFGMAKPVGGRIDANWGPVNQDWYSTIKLARQHNETTNIIFISQGHDEYSDKIDSTVPDTTPKKTGVRIGGGGGGGMGKKTGRIIAEGQKKLPFLMDIRLRTFRADNTFKIEVIKALANEDIHGLELEPPLNVWPEIMGLITESDPSEWTK